MKQTESEADTGNLDVVTGSAAQSATDVIATNEQRAAKNKRQTRYIFLGCVLGLLLIFGADHVADQLPVPTRGPVTMQGAVHADSVKEHNDRSTRFLLEERQRASTVIPAGIPADQVSFVCGPAALFTALAGLDPSQTGPSFASYVNRVKTVGHFSSWGRNGMSRFEISAELERLGIPNHSILSWNGAYTAKQAVQAIDDGHVVLLIVNSANSYKAITGETFSRAGGVHVIRAIATRWDAHGRVDGIALYDVNAYSGSDFAGADRRPIEYVSYADLVRLLQVQITPSYRLIVSDKPLLKR